MNGIVVYLNNMGYWFEDETKLMQLLDVNCDEIKEGKPIDYIERD